MQKPIAIEDVLPLVQQLSLVDKVRLIEQITPQIKRDLHLISAAPRKSLRGLWRDLDITEEDIAESRQEMWQEFPREDI